MFIFDLAFIIRSNFATHFLIQECIILHKAGLTDWNKSVKEKMKNYFLKKAGSILTFYIFIWEIIWSFPKIIQLYMLQLYMLQLYMLHLYMLHLCMLQLYMLQCYMFDVNSTVTTFVCDSTNLIVIHSRNIYSVIWRD